MTNAYIEGCWDAFRAEAVPADLGKERVDELRLIFFCGAVATYELIKELMANIPDEGSLAKLQDIHVELGAFLMKEVNADGVRLDS